MHDVVCQAVTCGTSFTQTGFSGVGAAFGVYAHDVGELLSWASGKAGIFFGDFAQYTSTLFHSVFRAVFRG